MSLGLGSARIAAPKKYGIRKTREKENDHGQSTWGIGKLLCLCFALGRNSLRWYNKTARSNSTDLRWCALYPHARLLPRLSFSLSSFFLFLSVMPIWTNKYQPQIRYPHFFEMALEGIGSDLGWTILPCTTRLFCFWLWAPLSILRSLWSTMDINDTNFASVHIRNLYIYMCIPYVHIRRKSLWTRNWLLISLKIRIRLSAYNWCKSAPGEFFEAGRLLARGLHRVGMK